MIRCRYAQVRAVWRNAPSEETESIVKPIVVVSSIVDSRQPAARSWACP